MKTKNLILLFMFLLLLLVGCTASDAPAPNSDVQLPVTSPEDLLPTEDAAELEIPEEEPATEDTTVPEESEVAPETEIEQEQTQPQHLNQLIEEVRSGDAVLLTLDLVQIRKAFLYDPSTFAPQDAIWDLDFSGELPRILEFVQAGIFYPCSDETTERLHDETELRRFQGVFLYETDEPGGVRSRMRETLMQNACCAILQFDLCSWLYLDGAYYLMDAQTEAAAFSLVEQFSQARSENYEPTNLTPVLVPLTADEIAWFNESFFNTYEPGKSVLANHLLNSQFHSVDRIDLYELFYGSTRVGDSAPELTDEEIEQLVAAGLNMDLDVVKWTREQMNEVLTTYCGITLEETCQYGLDKFVYLEAYDAYYLARGDTHFQFYTVESGHKYVSGEIGARYTEYVGLLYRNSAGEQFAVTLAKAEDGYGGYHFVMNVQIER